MKGMRSGATTQGIGFGTLACARRVFLAPLQGMAVPDVVQPSGIPSTAQLCFGQAVRQGLCCVCAGVLYPLTHQLMPPWVAAVAMAASR